MHRIVQEYFEGVDYAAGPSELCDTISTTAIALGFQAFAFLAVSAESEPILISTYPKEWTDCYIERGYEGRDPVILRAGCVREAFVWDRSVASDFGDDARAFFCEAEKFDIRCGLTIPLPGLRRGFSAMTFVTDQGGESLATRLHSCGQALLFMAYHFRSHLRRSLEPTFLLEGVEITPRERECLEWAARGKSRRDTAEIMAISRRMVVRDLENVKDKLGVRTIGQAIAIYTAWKSNRLSLVN